MNESSRLARLTTAEQWESLKSLITQVWWNQNGNMQKVKRAVEGAGYTAETGMFRWRLKKWGLIKNLKCKEVELILREQRDNARIGLESIFFLRGHPVDLSHVESHKKRRKLRVSASPVTAQERAQFPHLVCHTSPTRCLEIYTEDIQDILSISAEPTSRSVHVQITNENSNYSAAEPTPLASAQLQESESQIHQTVDCFNEAGVGHIENNLGYGYDSRDSMPITALAMRTMRDPDVYILVARAIKEFQSYCLDYITGSNGRVEHHEPPVHQFTCQGRLQNHIDEAVFHFARNDVKHAFANFRLAFLVMEEMLEDVHPMAIAQFLMLLCRLIANKANDVARKMLEHVIHLCGIRKAISGRLLRALQALYISGELLELPLLCLRAAVDCIVDPVMWQWKGLYIRERYCHALILSGFTGEGAERRAKLLDDQQSFYGTSARNVLWTALNVAEDCLLQRQLREAEYRYTSILEQSDNLSGFHRAKVRAGALHGLAEVARARSQQRFDLCLSYTASQYDREVALQHLSLAEGLAKGALDLAEVWFDGAATRRIVFLRERYEDVRALSAQIQGVSITL